MEYTSSEANKLLKKLNQDLNTLRIIDRQSSTFLAATGEDVESVRPSYDYKKISMEIQELCEKIRIVKHAINVFNTTTTVPGFDMCIDELLVLLPQLNERVDTLQGMISRLPKERERTFGQGTSATIDYRYINYDLDVVRSDYEANAELLAKAQTALDLVNNTVKMDIPF